MGALGGDRRGFIGIDPSRPVAEKDLGLWLCRFGDDGFHRPVPAGCVGVGPQPGHRSTCHERRDRPWQGVPVRFPWQCRLSGRDAVQHPRIHALRLLSFGVPGFDPADWRLPHNRGCDPGRLWTFPWHRVPAAVPARGLFRSDGSSDEYGGGVCGRRGECGGEEGGGWAEKPSDW